MAQGLYIGGTKAHAGKNMLCIGLGLRFQKEGLQVGYIKPVGALPTEKSGVAGDEDAFFVQSVLGLNQPAELTSPILASQDFKMRAFAGQVDDHMPELLAAYDILSREQDLMLVSGTGHLVSGGYCRLGGPRIIKELDLKALIIDRLGPEVNYDELLHAKELLGERMIGAVLNDVPFSLITEVDSVILPFLKRSGIEVLGLIPRDPLMGSIRAHELAEGLGGRLIAAQGRADGMVENFLIGTMQVENFMTYFRRNPNAAVIVGGDRTDIQLVAIEGNCPCLVLTGNLFPNDIILSRADTLDVPIIIVRQDTYTIAKKMELLLNRHKMRDVMKIRQGAQLISNGLDFDLLRTKLGLGAA